MEANQGYYPAPYCIFIPLSPMVSYTGAILVINGSFKIREPLPDDIEFILKTWSREIEKTKPRFADGSSCCPKRIFFNQYQKRVIVPLMSKCTARVIVPTSDPSYICGFVVGRYMPATAMVIHFAYVRPPFRRMGLCSESLRDMGWVSEEIVATHWTRYLNRFQIPGLILNEYLIYGVSDV